MSKEISTTDLVLAAESSAATSDDFVRELKESFTDKVTYEQQQRTTAANKEKYERDLKNKYSNKAQILLNGIWRLCRKSPERHSFLTRIEFKGINISVCSICQWANENDDNNSALACQYNRDQIDQLGNRLLAKDKKAGLILSYEELGRD